MFGVYLSDISPDDRAPTPNPAMISVDNKSTSHESPHTKSHLRSNGKQSINLLINENEANFYMIYSHKFIGCAFKRIIKTMKFLVLIIAILDSSILFQ